MKWGYLMMVKRLTRAVGLLILLGSLAFQCAASAQDWIWTTSQIDIEGTDSSVAVDHQGNVHVAYRFLTHGQLKYAFLPAGKSRWFTMTLDQLLDFFLTGITVDPKGNPYICYSPGVIKVAAFDGQRWNVQRLDPGSPLISYYCSIKTGADGAPQLSWYVEAGFTLRYATLQNGAWVARTIDTEELPGKFNSLAIDHSGKPQVSYISLSGTRLKYARFDGQEWIRTTVEGPNRAIATSRGDTGMGNSIAIDPDGNPMISYFDTSSLKSARMVNNKWKFEVIDHFPATPQWGWRMFRTTTVFDKKGYPHIGYQCPLGLKHAWWDGHEWKTSVILAPAGPTFDGGMAMDDDDNIYFSYTDPAQKTLRLAIGRRSGDQQTAEAQGSPETNKQP
jgi:hypothetical protein